MNTRLLIGTLCAAGFAASSASAAFVVNADTADPGFSFGAGTTTAGTSIASAAVGTNGTSLFGGDAPLDGNPPDNYTFTYDLGVDADNFSPGAGSLLGSTTGFGTELASGVAGGASGTYNVYITAPATTNVNTAGSTVTISNDGADVVLPVVIFNNGGTGVDLDAGPAFVGGANNSWLFIGTVNLTAGNAYTVTVEANANTFVSQRTSAVMWEAAVPEPGSLALLGLGGLGLLRRRR